VPFHENLPLLAFTLFRCPWPFLCKIKTMFTGLLYIVVTQVYINYGSVLNVMFCHYMYQSIIIEYPKFNQRFILHRCIFIDTNPNPDKYWDVWLSHKLIMVYNFVLCMYSIITLIHSDYTKGYTLQHYSTLQSTIKIEGLLGYLSRTLVFRKSVNNWLYKGAHPCMDCLLE
jgi:hypothetical protein